MQSPRALAVQRPLPGVVLDQVEPLGDPLPTPVVVGVQVVVADDLRPGATVPAVPSPPTHLDGCVAKRLEGDSRRTIQFGRRISRSSAPLAASIHSTT